MAKKTRHEEVFGTSEKKDRAADKALVKIARAHELLVEAWGLLNESDQNAKARSVNRAVRVVQEAERQVER